MPIFKAVILNKEINVNYVENEKDKLIQAIESINLKLKNYDNQNGKISDSKLLSFLAINLQADLLSLEKNKLKQNIFTKNYEEVRKKNISLNNKIYELSEKNILLEKENELINQELINIKSQIDTIIRLVKNTYDE
tara:strand:+ start:2813 stop:3220 length:408 start_codon:yes stop_codon:yes gene_type:complete